MIWDRRWPLQKYVDLCTILSYQFEILFFVLGGQEEITLKKELAEKTKLRNPAANLTIVDKESLNETANYIQQCDLFIGNDSGLTHLAVAIETPTMAIFGPSNHFFWGAEKIDEKHCVISAWPQSQNIADISVERVLGKIMQKLPTTTKFQA